MAKKKRRKEVKKSKDYMIELKGIFLLLICIVGCCPFGIVADIIKGFAAFLVGVWWAILLVLIGICGIYMIINRHKPNFFTAKLVGLYIIIISVCILSHVGYMKNLSFESYDVNKFKIIDNGVQVVQATISNMFDFINNGIRLSGGGIIGSIFASILCGLLTLNGTMVVAITLIVCGSIMFTGVSIYDIFKKTKEGTQNIATKVRKSKPKEEIEVPEVTDSASQGMVISSLDELKNQEPEPAKEEAAIIKPSNEDDNKNYKYPPITLLKKPSKGNSKDNSEAIKHNVPILIQVLKDFGIEGKVVAAHVGPAVTQYELEIRAGTKVNKILSLNR